jgi:hypothetical protein
LPEFVVVRKVLGTHGGQMELGEPQVIHGQITGAHAADETLQHFMTTKSLTVPKDLGAGDPDYDPIFDIPDTAVSRRLFPKDNQWSL